MKYKPHPGYCLACGSREQITRDHVVPKSMMNRLGLHSPKFNFQPLCQPCNHRKGAEVVDYRPHAEHDRLVDWLRAQGVEVEFERRGAAEPKRSPMWRPRVA